MSLNCILINCFLTFLIPHSTLYFGVFVDLYILLYVYNHFVNTWWWRQFASEMHRFYILIKTCNPYASPWRSQFFSWITSSAELKSMTELRAHLPTTSLALHHTHSLKMPVVTATSTASVIMTLCILCQWQNEAKMSTCRDGILYKMSLPSMVASVLYVRTPPCGVQWVRSLNGYFLGNAHRWYIISASTTAIFCKCDWKYAWHGM